MGEPVLKFRTPEVPRQEGEYARLRILKGPDFGSVFVVREASLVVGRSEEATIRLSDLKASRTHARIEYTRSGWKLTDLGSANGIFYRGEYVRECALTSGDHFMLGDTIVEFLMNHESNRALTAPILEDPDLERREIALARQRIKVRSAGEPVRIVQRAGTKSRSKGLLIALLVAAAAYSFPEYSVPILREWGLDFIADFLPPDPAAARKKTAKKGQKDEKKEEVERDLSSYLPPGEDSDGMKKESERYFQEGFREFRAGNYLRARDAFELALQMNPTHEKAKRYRDIAIRDSELEVKRLIDAGLRAVDSGRFSQAKAFFEMALRRLPEDEENPQVKTCRNALKELNSGGRL